MLLRSVALEFELVVVVVEGDGVLMDIRRGVCRRGVSFRRVVDEELEFVRMLADIDGRRALSPTEVFGLRLEGDGDRSNL